MNRPVKAILFDLDDTLLGNNINGFLESYFPLLAAYVSSFIEQETFLKELMTATQAMIGNDDPSSTNAEVFWKVFCRRTGLARETFEPFVDKFYQEEFGKLRPNTSRRPEAEEIVRSCLERGFRLVIATNPLFPRSAIEQRLEWAGVPVTTFDYDLVTAYENMHACKPHRAYYQEILSYIDVQPEQTIMVGDDWENDIRGANQTGIYTYWVTQNNEQASEEYQGLLGRGSLESFHRLLVEEDIRPAPVQL